MSEPTQPPPLKQLSPDCKHEEVNAEVQVSTIRTYHNATPHERFVEIRVQCALCGGDFAFKGMPWLASLDAPSVRLKGAKAVLPIEPWTEPAPE